MVWERTGTIDDMKDAMEPGKEYSSFAEAKAKFERRYKIKTGNLWADYPRFKGLL